MSQGPHRTILTYDLPDDSRKEVGEVTCVPRINDLVWVYVDGKQTRFYAKNVSWAVDPKLPITWVVCSLGSKP